MRVTDTLVNFELINVLAQEACSFTSSGNKSFGNLNFLKIQTKPQTSFMTLELNQGILNGSLKQFQADEQTNIAFMSSGVSDENGLFTDTWVQGNLGDLYNFIGITLDFGEFYPKKVSVEYYRNNVRIVHKEIDEIDNTWVFIDMKAVEIDTVKVIFEESWAPFQYANLQEFLFGNVIEWTADDIVGASMQEETDIISKVIPNDTFTLTIYSKDDDFSVLNPKGAYSYLLPNQKFKITETIYELDSDTQEMQIETQLNIGEFYLDTWESLFNRQIKFNLVSPLAQLDKTQFKKSRMYTGTTSAYSVLEDIFLDANWQDYEIDESLRNVFLKGYIPVCTHKQAIQQVAFVCNQLVYDNRSNLISIKPFDVGSVQDIPTTNIFDPISVKRKETVTGITVNVHNFSLKTETEEVFKGYLEAGRREIIFSSPCTNLSIPSGLSLIEDGINYAVLNVSNSAEYSIRGQKYEDSNYKYFKEISDDMSVKKNNLDIDKAMLINPNNVSELAEKWISYFRMYNLAIEFKFISAGQRTGENITFRDNENRIFTGAFIRQNLDVGGGFLSSCYLIGFQQTQEVEAKPLFAGDKNIENSSVELYSNEDYGIV